MIRRRIQTAADRAAPSCGPSRVRAIFALDATHGVEEIANR